MNMESFQIARVNTGDDSQTLLSPYQMNEADIIKAGETFTLRLTTISKSVVDHYGEKMFRGRYGNEYFVVMSHFGIGSNNQQGPSSTINFIESQKNIRGDVLSFWGENIRWIEDYRDSGQDGNAGRIFLRISAMFQTLGNSPLEEVRQGLINASDMVGRFSPALVPYSSVARLAIEGVSKIVGKLKAHPEQIVESTITLYPCSESQKLARGDAYLQRGSYIFFFEETPIKGLSLTESGRVIADETFKGNIPPYAVVNIVDGLYDSPSSALLDKAVALDILEKYDKNFGVLSGGASESSGSAFNEGLTKIGESYRMLAKIRRFNELQAKMILSEPEQSRLATLREELKSILSSALV